MYVLDQLPFGINYVIFPILLLFFAMAVCILLSFLTNTSFQISFLHLISLKIGEKQRLMIGDLFSMPREIRQEAVQSVRESEGPRLVQVKGKQHCSDIQLLDSEGSVRVEDITSQRCVELDVEGRKSTSSDTSKTTKCMTQVDSTAVENLSGKETESKQKLCRSGTEEKKETTQLD